MYSYKLYKSNRKLYSHLHGNINNIIGGSWNCNNCTFANNDFLSECEMCEAKKEINDTKIKDHKENKTETTWTCPECTFENRSSTTSCEMCETAKSVDKIFYIYTTGITDWNDMKKTPTIWNTIILESVLKSIPDSFTKIVIAHYDPLYDQNDVPIQEPVRKQTKQNMNTYVVANDKKKSTFNRSVQSSFNDKVLEPTEIKNPHIILDFSHYVLEYDAKEKVKMVGSGKKIKGLYIGYVGEIQPVEYTGYNTVYQAENNFFSVSDNGTVTTYIDKLMERGYKKFDFIENKALENIYNDIVKKCKGVIPPTGNPNRETYIIREDKFNENTRQETFEEEHIITIQFIKPLIKDLIDAIMAPTIKSIDTIITELVKKYTPIYMTVTN